jgi:hypothetical protein
MRNNNSLKEEYMFRSLLVFIVIISSLSATDIRISKDSMWVYNSNVSSKADAVIFSNNSFSAIHLDSMHVIIEEMDTIGFGYLPAGHGMEAAWNAKSTHYPYFVWRLESIGNKEFVLKKEEFIPPDSLPLSFTGNGDSAQIFKLSIGYCFICESMPRYPRYFKGTMKFYFNNGQTIAIRLYSDDLRTPVKTSLRRGSIETCLDNDSLDFSSINDTCQKRNSSGGSCSFNTCVIAIPDVRMTQQKAYAKKGIMDLGFFSDTNCLDTLKRVPSSGYLDSVNFLYTLHGHVFAVRTSEMNYAVLHFLGSGSGLPFNYLKWAYQPDGTADFIKVTSVQTIRREPNTTLGNVKTILNRNNFMVSWAPVSGTLQFQLFDLKGRQLHYWECDGRQGAIDAPMKELNIAPSTHILQILLHNETELTKKRCILLPR